MLLMPGGNALAFAGDLTVLLRYEGGTGVGLVLLRHEGGSFCWVALCCLLAEVLLSSSGTRAGPVSFMLEGNALVLGRCLAIFLGCRKGPGVVHTANKMPEPL